MKKGHVESTVHGTARNLISGAWLEARRPALAVLTKGLRLETERFPLEARDRFVNAVVTAVAMSEVTEQVFSDDKRIQDLQEMASAARQFLDVCQRTSVLAAPLPIDYGSEPGIMIKQVADIEADTKLLRTLRNEALQAVKLYLLGLEAALSTATQRGRGDKRKADEIGLFARVAALYKRHLGDPMSTPGGSFSNVVVHIKAYQLGKPARQIKSVERIVRAALKSI